MEIPKLGRRPSLICPGDSSSSPPKALTDNGGWIQGPKFHLEGVEVPAEDAIMSHGKNQIQIEWLIKRRDCSLPAAVRS